MTSLPARPHPGTIFPARQCEAVHDDDGFLRVHQVLEALAACRCGECFERDSSRTCSPPCLWLIPSGLSRFLVVLDVDGPYDYYGCNNGSRLSGGEPGIA
jgi:hypothetical protein